MSFFQALGPYATLNTTCVNVPAASFRPCNLVSDIFDPQTSATMDGRLSELSNLVAPSKIFLAHADQVMNRLFCTLQVC